MRRLVWRCAKNIGPSGVTIVIVRKDLMGHSMKITPSIWDWSKQAANQSMLNTPPTFAIYMAGLGFKWLLKQGGVKAIEKRNQEKRTCSTTSWIK